MSTAGEITAKSLKHTFWDVFDHLWIFALANLMAVLLCLPIVTMPLGLAGIFHMAGKAARDQEPCLADFFIGVKRLWRRFYVVAAVKAVVAVFGIVNVWFYLSVRRDWVLLGMFAAGICFWVVVSFFLGQLYVGPLACRADLTLRQAYRLGYALFVRHLGSTLLGAFHLLLVLLLLTITAVGLLLFGFVVPILFAHNLTTATAHAEGLPDFERQEETRGLRSLLRPWDE